MKLPYTLAALAVFTAVFADDKKTTPLKPCTIKSTSTGSFFDLSPLHLEQPAKDAKASKGERDHSWTALGHDYGANFTMNFCGPVVEKLDDVEGVRESMWKNISAYYTKGKHTYSIGYDYDRLVRHALLTSEGPRTPNSYCVARSSS